MATIGCGQGATGGGPSVPEPDVMSQPDGESTPDTTAALDTTASADTDATSGADAESDGASAPDVPPSASVVCEGAGDPSSVLLVAPYLQLATPTSMWIRWETETGTESRVDWGPTEALGQATCGESWQSWTDTPLHAVQLTGLEPDTRYFYRASTSGVVSDVTSFVTPEDPADEGESRFIVVSDMQKDGGNPSVWREIVEDGVIPFATALSGGDVADAVDVVMIPGDLVDEGWDIADWRDDFFPMSSALSSQVPIYPVLGNHEGSTPFFYDYFQLPQNGTPAYVEHWWWHDQGNVRMIGLDSNTGFRIQTQLDWLDEVLQETCTDPAIDFVFAQLHHPFKSELWLPGEVDYTGDVISRLESFSTTCDKPSIHFFGHTHGYSRGQSRDHRHLWVNAATAGGNIDYWGEYAQTDYDEFTVTTDDWGFVFVEVTAKPVGAFTLRRVSRGDEEETLDNLVTDVIEVRRDNLPPTTPYAVPPPPSAACAGALTLAGSPFEDLDGGIHDASHWQLAATCEDFSEPLVDAWVQRQNVYQDVDQQADELLEDHALAAQVNSGEVCMRVRYRDDGLVWSDWSEPVAFVVGGTLLGDGLVTNGGAEDGIEGWTVTAGELESLSAGECDGVAPATGERYFSVGGLCITSGYGEAQQMILVDPSWHAAIDGGQAVVAFGATFATWAGDDEPGLILRFIDDNGIPLGEPLQLTSQATSWTPLLLSAVMPAGTRSVGVVLTGTRNAGADNDSYVDDVHVTVMSCASTDPG